MSQRAKRSGRTAGCIAILSVWLQASLCSESDRFKGEVTCDGNPMVDATLEVGECAPLPLCPERGFVPASDWSILSDSAVNLADADNAEVRNDPDYKRLSLAEDGLGWGPSANGNLEICVAPGASPGKVTQGWLAIRSSKEIDGKYPKKLISYRITVAGDTPAPDAGVSEDAGVGADASAPDASTPDSGPPLYCGDGIVTPPEACDPAAPSGPLCTSACTLAPVVSIENAYVSPQLSPTDDSFLQRTTHFTGVTQYLIAELSGATEGTTVKVSSCSVSGAGDCSQLLNSTWSVGSSTTPFELSLPRSSAQTTYNLRLAAEPSGTESGLFDLTVELHPGKGTVDCEQAEDGGGMRWLGLKLLDEQESQVESANYHLYERKSVANGGGWSKVQDYASSTFVHRHVSAMEFDTDRTFLVIAEETGTGTTVAAREFMWAQNQASDTQGCRICTMRSLGYDCEIIPMGN